MRPEWKKGYDVPALLERVSRTQSPLEVELYLPVLLSAVEWPELIPESERLEIVRTTIAPSRGGDFTQSQDEVLRLLATRQREYLSRPYAQYVVLTSVSLSSRRRLNSRSALNCRIRFSSQTPKSFESDYVLRKGKQHETPEHPEDYKKVCVLVRARSNAEAWEVAFDALDLLRGMWNFGLGRRLFRTTFMGTSNKPFNRVLLGPRFTVHSPDGKLDAEGLGCIAPFHRVAPVADDGAWTVLRSAEARVTRDLQRIKYGQAIEWAMIRYCRALDQGDLNACFLELWSLLEFLTATEGDRYRELIRRVSALWDQPEPNRSVLEHLRVTRNQQVHAGRGTELGEVLVSQAKYFVEELFVFHLTRGHQFESREESGQFLALPLDVEALRRRHRLYTFALSARESDRNTSR